MIGPDVDSLTTEQTHMALRFLLHRVDTDTRAAMMATLPTVYAALYPATRREIIIGHVTGRLSPPE